MVSHVISVPIHVVASFKKIKAVINSNSQLAMVLQNSAKLVSFFMLILCFCSWLDVLIVESLNRLLVKMERK